MAGVVEPLSHGHLCRVGHFFPAEDVLPGSGEVLDTFSFADASPGGEGFRILSSAEASTLGEVSGASPKVTGITS